MTKPSCCIHGCPRKPTNQIIEEYGRTHLLCGRHVNSYADGIYGRTRETVTIRPWPPPKTPPEPQPPPAYLFNDQET